MSKDQILAEWTLSPKEGAEAKQRIVDLVASRIAYIIDEAFALADEANPGCKVSWIDVSSVRDYISSTLAKHLQSSIAQEVQRILQFPELDGDESLSRWL